MTENSEADKKWCLDFSFASSNEVIKIIVNRAGENILAATLKRAEENIKINPNIRILSRNFLYAIICMLERYKRTREAQLLMNSMKLLQIICKDYHEERRQLVEMGIIDIFSFIVTNEAEKQISSYVLNETNESVTLVHVIAGFIKAVDNQKFHDLISSSNEFLLVGPNASQVTYQENRNSLKIVVPRLFKICQKPHCPTSYKILLLKTIYCGWNILSDLVKVQELIKYAKNLIDTNPIREDNIVIGFAIIWVVCICNFKQVINERVNESLKVKKSIISSWPHEGFKIVFDVFYRMITYWLKEDTISIFQIDEQKLIPRIEIINATLNHIMSITDKGKPSTTSLNIKYNNLCKTVKNILNMPDISRSKGKLTASSEGIRKFKDLVTFIVQTVDALIIFYDFFEVTSDLCDIEDLPVPKSPNNIMLELYRSASFDRVLGSSQSPEELRTDPLVRALRLLSILYEVNENWGILFCSLSTERLIDRSCFISDVLKEVMYRTKDKEINHVLCYPESLISYAKNYPFLMLKEHRETLFGAIAFLKYRSMDSKPRVPIDIPRKYILDNMVNILDYDVEIADKIWNFSFIDESAKGAGARKEFYTEFSHDCQRYSYGLWSGEAGEVVDGVSYVKSQSGLFPHPKFMSNPKTKSYLNTIGLIMAKAVVDQNFLDINFSHAFYKCLSKKNLDAQQLSLIDIKDVMPSTFKFVESLVDAMREKRCIQMDNSLTINEQNQAISNITCDGCSFEDLCVNFTLPSFPDIEMMEGGSETLLSIENIETYLKLLIWWLLYETPQKCIKEVRYGFERILDPNSMQYLYPYEYEDSICGLTKELWTVDILRQNCVLDGVSVNAPVIQYLFEILSSLSASDQTHFLQFVTATPRLPVGGLAALDSKLTIKLKGSDGDPDNYLPVSFTCSNTLFITAYSCKEALEEKLLFVIREGRNHFNYY